MGRMHADGILGGRFYTPHSRTPLAGADVGRVIPNQEEENNKGGQTMRKLITAGLALSALFAA
jgi:hypothetical protein